MPYQELVIVVGEFGVKFIGVADGLNEEALVLALV